MSEAADIRQLNTHRSKQWKRMRVICDTNLCQHNGCEQVLRWWWCHWRAKTTQTNLRLQAKACSKHCTWTTIAEQRNGVTCFIYSSHRNRLETWKSTDFRSTYIQVYSTCLSEFTCNFEIAQNWIFHVSFQVTYGKRHKLATDREKNTHHTQMTATKKLGKCKIQFRFSCARRVTLSLNFH